MRKTFEAVLERERERERERRERNKERERERERERGGRVHNDKGETNRKGTVCSQNPGPDCSRRPSKK